MFTLPVAQGVALALLETRHVEALARLIDDNRARLSAFLPWARDNDLEATRRFVADSLQKFAHGNGFDAGLVVDGELAGVLSLHYINHVVGRTELGYWLAARFEGRGVMTRAVRGLLPLLFEEYRLNRIEIRCHPENVRSRAVAERLGFRYEGTLRAMHAGGDGEPADAMVYGLLRDDWEQGDRAASSAECGAPVGESSSAPRQERHP